MIQIVSLRELKFLFGKRKGYIQTTPCEYFFTGLGYIFANAFVIIGNLISQDHIQDLPPRYASSNEEVKFVNINPQRR